MDKFENYEVTSIIGSGSFGTCYKVRHKTSLKEYVWKAVNYGQMCEKNKELLVSEVNLLSKLQHPNIVRYYNHIIHKKSSTLYIVMEYCTGGDLSRTIQRVKRNFECFEEVFVWRVLYQIALALQVCHSKCAMTVLHRDIKPANIFLDSEQNVKLGDFGLAKIVDKENFAESVVGTPLYMSPELIKHKKYNKKCDIWALGCLIYELCVLRPPFHGNSLKSLSIEITEGKFNKIPDIYSDDLQKMINFLLNTDVNNRPSIDVIIRHPTVLENSTRTLNNISRKLTNSNTLTENVFEFKTHENIQSKLENLRFRENALKNRENTLDEREQAIARREKKVALLERIANEKITRADLYLKQSKMNCKNKTHKSRLLIHEQSDASFSADPGDTSILPTSEKINERDIIRPSKFVRSRSERRVHFNRPKIFENNADDSVLKEYNFCSNNIDGCDESKTKKKPFSLSVPKIFNKKISQSNSSLGSKFSSDSEKANSEPILRPGSWTEENKKCAFSLLRLMNDKENISTQITHTKM